MGAMRFVPTAAAVAPLVETLENSDSSLRDEAAEALEAIGKEAVPLLVQALEGVSPEVFELICDILTRLGKFSDEAVPMLMQKVMSGPSKQRCAAMKVLANVGESARFV